MYKIYGTNSDDTIVGDLDTQYIYGLDGDDHITVPRIVTDSGVSVTVHGGLGEDTLKIDWGNPSQAMEVSPTRIRLASAADPAATSQYVFFKDIEHLDVVAGAGDDALIGTRYSWDRFDGGTGVDSWRDYFNFSATAMDIDMRKVATSTGQSFADGTMVKNIEYALDLVLTPGNDSFRDFGGFDDQVFAHDGDDTLRSSGGRDRLYGGDGNDTLIIDWETATARVQVEFNALGQAWVGDAVSFLDATQRVEFNTFETLKVFSGSAADSLTGSASLDIFRAGKGNDTLSGLEGDDRLYGDGGNDRIDGGSGADILKGGRGQDTATYTGSASGVSVSLTLGTGTGGDAEGDTLTAIENLVGSAFADTLTGDAGVNRLWGGDMGDRLDGKGDMDVLRGGAGRDVLLGSGGSDVLFGEKGNDRLKGGTQGDTLFGGGQADKLFGQGGDDRLNGGAGNDVLTGGTGRDVFVFAAGQDRITDFANNRDTIELGGAALGLSGLTVADVLAMATVIDGNTQIAFATGDTLVIEGLSNIGALTDDLTIL